MDVSAVRGKPVRFAIGLTAGESAVGIDAALARLKGSGPALHVKLVDYAHFPYTSGLRTRLLSVSKSARDMALLHFELGEALASAGEAMRHAAGREFAEVDFVALQGFPAARVPRRTQSKAAGVLEIGEPALVAERLGLPVVSEFCYRDVAAGGQGNVLSAYPSWALLNRADRTVARLHLGALARFAVVPPALEQVAAFDIGPCNMLIDGAAQLVTSGNRQMDEKGKAAASGVVLESLLDQLLEQQYFSRVPPKATSRDEFGPEVYLRELIAERQGASLEDLLATVTTAVAFSILRAYTRFVKPVYNPSRIILTGGGTENRKLVTLIREGMPEAVVRKSDEYGLDPAAMDPLCAAIMGGEAIDGKANNIPTATGARRPVVCGKLTLP